MKRALADRLTPSEAIEAVGNMLKGYANGGRDANGGYIGALADALSRYPRVVAVRCADRVNGLPRTCRFLPTVADIIAWCEPVLEDMRTPVERVERDAEYRRWQQEEPPPPQNAPTATASGLCARFGLTRIPNSYDALDITKAAARYGTGEALQKVLDAGIAQHHGAPSQPYAAAAEAAKRRMREADEDRREARMDTAIELGAEADRLAAQQDAAEGVVTLGIPDPNIYDRAAAGGGR